MSFLWVLMWAHSELAVSSNSSLDTLTQASKLVLTIRPWQFYVKCTNRILQCSSFTCRFYAGLLKCLGPMNNIKQNMHEIEAKYQADLKQTDSKTDMTILGANYAEIWQFIPHGF